MALINDLDGSLRLVCTEALKHDAVIRPVLNRNNSFNRACPRMADSIFYACSLVTLIF